MYKPTSVNGAVYSAYYDADNHRRLKVYPTGAKDEFSYSSAGQLVVDVGNEKLWRGSFHPVDEYVWVAGQPLLVLRGRMTNDFQREGDDAPSCMRNGEARACGLFAVVTDANARPALALDEAGKVAAVFEMQPFGATNRMETPGVVARPAQKAGVEALDQLTLPPRPGLTTELRLVAQSVDTVGDWTAPWDSLRARVGTGTGTGTGAPLASFGGSHRGRVTSEWVTVPDGGTAVQFEFSSSGARCLDDGGVVVGDAGVASSDGGAQAGACGSTGVSLAAVEYRLHAADARTFEFPLRLPGQYSDVETGLFENWNRYFEPSSGRYLSPEPFAQSPKYVLSEVSQASVVPMYAYAANNPIGYSDPNGLATYRCRKPLDALGGKDAPASDQRNGPDVKGSWGVGFTQVGASARWVI